ncbi:response regulator transcription factor [Clostridium botulinum]|nr:response regulator transcription factor [Clostridium botulinum]
MRIGICQNDVVQRNSLKNNLEKITKDTEIKCEFLEFNCGQDLLKNYTKMNIIFLDISIEKINGIDIAKKIREFDSVVEIIFITSLIDYIHQAYEVRAYRYLLTPVSYETIKYVTLKCLKSIEIETNLVIKYKGEIIILNIDDITYIEVMQKMLTIHTKEKKYMVKMTLRKFEEKLSQHDFFRCHKSFLVNLNKVKEFKDNIIRVNNTYIPISKYRLKEFRNKLSKIFKNSIWI